MSLSSLPVNTKNSTTPHVARFSAVVSKRSTTRSSGCKKTESVATRTCVTSLHGVKRSAVATAVIGAKQKPAKTRSTLHPHHSANNTSWSGPYDELHSVRLTRQQLHTYVGEAVVRDPRTLRSALLKLDVLVCRRLLIEFGDHTAIPDGYIDSLAVLQMSGTTNDDDRHLHADIATILKHHPRVSSQLRHFMSSAQHLAATNEFAKLEHLLLNMPAHQRAKCCSALSATGVRDALLVYSRKLQEPSAWLPPSSERRAFFSLLSLLNEKFSEFSVARSIFLEALKYRHHDDVLLDVIATFDPLHIGITVTADTFFPALRRLLLSNSEAVRYSQLPLMFLVEMINATTPTDDIPLAIVAAGLVPLALMEFGTNDNAPRDICAMLFLLALMHHGSPSVVHRCLLSVENLLPALASILQAGGKRETHLKHAAQCYSLLFRASLQQRYAVHP